MAEDDIPMLSSDKEEEEESKSDRYIYNRNESSTDTESRRYIGLYLIRKKRLYPLQLRLKLPKVLTQKNCIQ